MNDAVDSARAGLGGSPLAQRFLRGAAWSVLGAVASSGVTLLTLIFVARLLGKVEYGQFVVIQGTLGMVGVFAGFGIGATATRYVAELKERDAARLGRILALSERAVLIFGLVAAAGLALTAGWLAEHTLNQAALRVPLALAAASVLFAAVDGYQKSVLVGFEATRAFAVGTVAGVVAGLPVMLLATLLYGLPGSAGAMVANALIQAGISRWQMRRELRRSGVRRGAPGSLREARVLRDFALPALLGGAVVAPAHWAVQAMLANTPAGYAELAVLGIAMQWFNVIMFLPGTLIVLPILTDHVTRSDHPGSRRVLLLAMAANAMVAIPLAALVGVLSPHILGWYGKGFEHDVVPLRLAVATAALLAIQTPVGYLLAASSRMWLAALMNAGWAIAYLAAAYWLVDRGATGAMAALAAAYLIHTIWTLWFGLHGTRYPAGAGLPAMQARAATKDRNLYLMHVDWHWIKQRPHFVAEGLAARYAVLVAYPRANRRSQLLRNTTTLSTVPMWAVPFARLRPIAALNAWIRTVYVRALVSACRPAVVWITFPTLLPPPGSPLPDDVVVVYDCMDDAPEFKSDPAERTAILAAERRLLEQADLILVSSANLHGKLLARGAAADKLELVRNAFGGSIVDAGAPAPVAATPAATFRILYIGTISDYLDFDLLLHCVAAIEQVEFHFFGPALVGVPAHPRLVFHGAVEHAGLAARAREFDCLAMPFVVNELVRGVDPVKLYEYINFNKNIVCPWYAEIDRFAEFVHFYRDRGEFVAVVRGLMHANEVKYDLPQRQRFLEENGWPVRVAAIGRRIDQALAAKRTAGSAGELPR